VPRLRYEPGNANTSQTLCVS